MGMTRIKVNVTVLKFHSFSSFLLFISTHWRGIQKMWLDQS